MKRIIIFLILITIFGASCKKDNTELTEEEQELRESNLAFINSDWTFDATGDSFKDQVIGLWLSNEVSYEDIICNDCDNLFTWVIESTGIMVTRNNGWGDHETMYGNWEVDNTKKIILFSYKVYPNAGTGDISDNYQIMTDTIKIEKLSNSNLWITQFIDYPPTTKMEVKFSKLK